MLFFNAQMLTVVAVWVRIYARYGRLGAAVPGLWQGWQRGIVCSAFMLAYCLAKLVGDELAGSKT